MTKVAAILIYGSIGSKSTSRIIQIMPWAEFDPCYLGFCMGVCEKFYCLGTIAALDLKVV